MIDAYEKNKIMLIQENHHKTRYVNSGISLQLTISILIIITGRLLCVIYPDYSDSMLFSYIGEMLNHNKKIYIDLWDIKPPGIFITNQIYNSIGEIDTILRNIGEFLVISSGLFPIIKIIRQTISKDKNIINFTLISYSILSSGIMFYVGGNHTETYVTSLSLWSVYFLSFEIPRKLIISGALISISSLFKLNGISILICYYIYSLITLIHTKKTKDNIYNITCITIGFILPWIITLLLLHEQWRELLYASFIYPFEYATGSYSDLITLIRHIYETIGPLIIFTPSYVVCFYIAVKLTLTKKRERNFLLFICGWVISDLLSAIAGIRAYSHYFILIVATLPISIIVSLSYISQKTSINEKIFLIFFILYIATQVAFQTYISIQKKQDYKETKEHMDGIINHITKNSNHNDLIWVKTYYPYIYKKTHLMSASKYTTNVNLYDQKNFNIKMANVIINDIQLKKPRWIVAHKNNRNEFNRSLSKIINDFYISELCYNKLCLYKLSSYQYDLINNYE